MSVRSFYHFILFVDFFFFSFSFPFFDILRIGTRDDNMYKISDCHLSFVSAAVTIECVLCFEIV